MKTTVNLLSFFLVLSIFTLSSCDKLNDLVSPKTDVEKLHEYINSSDWNVDTISSKSSDPFVINFVDNYPPITSGKVTFSKVTEGQGYTKGTMTRVQNINGQDSTTVTPYLMADATYFKLYYPNPNIGLTDIEIIYNITEKSNNKFTFIREETLVSSTNGALLGYANTIFKLKR